MADDNNKQVRLGPIKRLANLIQGNNDALYRSTYYSDPTNKQQLQALKTDITNTIKDIMVASTNNNGEPNISKLYERLLYNTQNDKSTMDAFETIFSDNDFVNNLTASYLDNRWVRATDLEIDEILKYMPKLQEALDTITDNVLSADSFSKDFLNIKNKLSDGDTSTEQFDKNIEDLKKDYKLLKFIKEIYQDTSKYGETFVYCVPYDKAIQRLLDKKFQTRGVSVKANYGENAIYTESAELGRSKVDIPEGYTLQKSDNFNINIKIESGLISSIIESEMKTRDKLKNVNEQSIYHEAIDTIDGIHRRAFAYDRTMDVDADLGTKYPKKKKFDQTLGDSLELPDDANISAQDGLVNKNGAGKIKQMNGVILKKLKRERVVPIIINDICLGYYYFEFDNDLQLFDERQSSTGMVNTLTGLRSNGRSEAFDSMERRKQLLRSIAAQLADKIDNKFVDNNQDLKKEIYYILKYNDDYNENLGMLNNIKISYIPPEDIHHIYFELNEDTCRGVSDLQLSLVPAKLWVAIYITNCLAIMTRGNDKRVYYVRQSVESNISKTLLKTINEIKKANFGIRQIENINSVLNITGRFNDYIIPRGADGQSPIEFEVMPGQQVEIKTDLLNLLEESAINPTGVPIEIIQNRQSPDYAMQLTMSNSKFLRFVYDRQAVFQDTISPLLTKIYDLEYATRDMVTLLLPPPLFINVTNTNQLIVNTNDYCENIVNIVCADEQDDTVKQKFSKELKIYSLGSYLNMSNIMEIYNKAKQEITMDKMKQNIVDDAGGEEY